MRYADDESAVFRDESLEFSWTRTTRTTGTTNRCSMSPAANPDEVESVLADRNFCVAED